MAHKPALLLAALVAVAAPLSAAASPPSPVVVSNGGCGSGYTDVANVGSTYVCRRDLQPDVKILNTHCPAGYTEAGSGQIDTWICVRY